MNTWKELERAFREIPNPYDGLRADWSHQDDIPNHWILAGWYNRDTLDHFEALARSAGRKVLHSKVALTECLNEVLEEQDDLTRWLTVIKQMTNRYKDYRVGGLYDENNQFVGNIRMGTIDNVIEASALLCMRLLTEEDEYRGENTEQQIRVHLDDIYSFQKIRTVGVEDIRLQLLNGRIEISEAFIKKALEEILDVAVHQADWGGEDDDLYTANLILDGGRTPTAFALKGPGVRAKTLQIAHCGKNGDQLVRLFQAPAELFVLQFIGSVAETVVKDMETNTRYLQSIGRLARFCIIDGQDTARLLRAYGKL